MGKRMLPANDATLSSTRAPIDLRIHGSDIFLSGHFHRWQAMVSRGPDLDVLSVQMAVDVTSPDQLLVPPVGSTPDLFSFTSTNLMKLDDKVFRAEGQLRTSTGTHPFDLMIEVPEGHNAFFALAFSGRRDVLGNVWPELMAASGVGDLDAERRLDPRAGVRDLLLAAA